MIFLATAHDESRVSWLEELDVPAVKIGSGERKNPAFIRHLASLGRPVILSTGMYDEADVEEALGACASAANDRVALLHCVTSYPTPSEAVNLAAMDRLVDRHLRRLQLDAVAQATRSRGASRPWPSTTRRAPRGAPLPRPACGAAAAQRLSCPSVRHFATSGAPDLRDRASQRPSARRGAWCQAPTYPAPKSPACRAAPGRPCLRRPISDGARHLRGARSRVWRSGSQGVACR